MCPRAAPTCEVCDKLVSKYKCPSCLVPYCSLGCFKIHKETPCAKPSSTEETPAASPVETLVVPLEEAHALSTTHLNPTTPSPTKEVHAERPIHVEEENFVLDKSQLDSIASSSELRKALKDQALHKLIRDIDSSSNPLQELDEAMKVEAFRVFTEKVLLNICESK